MHRSNHSKSWSPAGYMLITLIGLSAGCGDGSGSPVAVPVSGVVSCDGQPLSDAEIYFMTSVHTGYGRTDSNGRYELVQGAAPGENRVFITKRESGAGVNPDPDAGMDLEQLQAAAVGAADPQTGRPPAGTVLPVELVPVEYSDPERSKLTFNVPEDGTEGADFRL